MDNHKSVTLIKVKEHSKMIQLIDLPKKVAPHKTSLTSTTSPGMPPFISDAQQVDKGNFTQDTIVV